MAHSYGPTCVYRQEKSIALNGRRILPPPVRAQFFYTSPSQIDDPLAAVPVTSKEKLTNEPPKPFSPYDNIALERAQRDFLSRDHDFHKNSPLSILPKKSFQLKSLGKGSSSVQGLNATDDATSTQSKGRGGYLDGQDAKDLYPRSLDGPTEMSVTVAPESSHSLPKDNRRPFLRFNSNRRPQGNDGAYDSDLVSEKGTETGHAVSPKTMSVTVGVSRLHVVEIPSLVMKPIYWSQINDLHKVVRATWLFKHSMLPVPEEIAERLESGYQEIMPYLPVYQDELEACIANGPAAELRIVQRLFPEDRDSSRPTTPLRSGTDGPANAPSPQDSHQYRKWSTIFVNSTDAQMLKPSLLPSESRNRRPLSAIRKGREIGVAVVRGFDRRAWLKLHPDNKLEAEMIRDQADAINDRAEGVAVQNDDNVCGVCEKEHQAPSVRDLVLVIHGIGQKLSQRVDSYHFTHAINGLRRALNVELASSGMSGHLEERGGPMVLPVNWRLLVSFEEPLGKTSNDTNTYDLADITPESLPAVRSLISDVMLDIPYYMSHHKQRMTSAVVKEANRIYRLWCHNNPDFKEGGRVHLVAHSLGSVMTMDILSSQATRVSGDAAQSIPSSQEFEFDVTNLFCCGSPMGFFLLMNKASLMPRKGRNKKGMEHDDRGRGVASEAAYGCLAVDNIYNILHRNDPVAYQLNACVDADYALSLAPAVIPTPTQGWIKRMSGVLHLSAPIEPTSYGIARSTSHPPLESLPSTVELETHNFTREELSEKRMYLLNDNGQIDYILQPPSGPLDFQYLDMLGAHSSYWYLQDFARFLVVEIKRAPGRSDTIPALRAQKKREYRKI